MDIREKISSLADGHPELLGYRGKLTYMLCSALPYNTDTSDMTVIDVMGLLSDEHLEYVYNTLSTELEGRTT